MHLRNLLAGGVSTALAMLICGTALAQPKPADPDWPCQQLLVPQLSAGSYWAGPPLPQTNGWRDDPKLFALVQTAVNRDTPDAEATEAVTKYIHTVPPRGRSAAAAKLFGAIVDEANDERQQVITHIDDLSRRQQRLSQTIDGINKQIDAIPASAAGDQATQRTDLVNQRDFNIQTFQDAQHTIRYACEVPVAFERRLGLLARTLTAAIGKPG